MMPPLFNLIIDLSSLTRVPALEWPGALLAWSVRWDASVDWRCLLGRNTVAIQCRDARSPSTIWICDFARDKRCQWRRDGERCGCSQMLTRRSWQPILLISTAGRQLCFCPQRHLPGNPLDIYSACELRRASYCIFLPFIATFARANTKLLR